MDLAYGPSFFRSERMAASTTLLPTKALPQTACTSSSPDDARGVRQVPQEAELKRRDGHPGAVDRDAESHIGYSSHS
jgi:hypothetical protein